MARVSQSQALLAPLRGAQREAWWLAVASMVLCMLLAVALMGWMAQPLAQLTFKARQLLRTSARQQPAQDVHWPRAGGEVGELVRVFQGLVQQGSLQQSRKDTVVGQFQAVLDSAPVGIVITRHQHQPQHQGAGHQPARIKVRGCLGAGRRRHGRFPPAG